MKKQEKYDDERDLTLKKEISQNDSNYQKKVSSNQGQKISKQEEPAKKPLQKKEKVAPLEKKETKTKQEKNPQPSETKKKEKILPSKNAEPQVTEPVVPKLVKPKIEFHKKLESSIWRPRKDYSLQNHSTSYTPEVKSQGDINLGLKHQESNIRLNYLSHPCSVYNGLTNPYRSVRNLNFVSGVILSEMELLQQAHSYALQLENNENYEEEITKFEFILYRLRENAYDVSLSLRDLFNAIQDMERLVYPSDYYENLEDNPLNNEGKVLEKDGEKVKENEVETNKKVNQDGENKAKEEKKIENVKLDEKDNTRGKSKVNKGEKLNKQERVTQENEISSKKMVDKTPLQ